MPGNTLGQSFRITTAGESHGPANIVIIDGCPPGLSLSVQDLQSELDRRRPGTSAIVSARSEPDVPEILSGVFEGETTGTSIAIQLRNIDQKERDYSEIEDRFRPGHADFSYNAKYGFRDFRGGGRASARETVVRVAAGVVARKVLDRGFGGTVLGYVKQIGDLVATVADPSLVSRSQVEQLADGSKNLVRCPDHERASEMVALIEAVKADRDSIGGIAEIVATDVPAGLGEPVFDKLEADLAKALFSIPAVMGVEYGSGFSCASQRGSEHNDRFIMSKTKVRTATNRHGGVLGGISTGMPLVLRAAVKPTSSIPKEQQTVTTDGESTIISTKGRHDPCLLPRFVPIAEAMVAIVLADHWLRWRGQIGSERTTCW